MGMVPRILRSGWGHRSGLYSWWAAVGREDSGVPGLGVPMDIVEELKETGIAKRDFKVMFQKLKESGVKPNMKTVLKC